MKTKNPVGPETYHLKITSFGASITSMLRGRYGDQERITGKFTRAQIRSYAAYSKHGELKRFESLDGRIEEVMEIVNDRRGQIAAVRDRAVARRIDALVRSRVEA